VTNQKEAFYVCTAITWKRKEGLHLISVVLCCMRCLCPDGAKKLQYCHPDSLFHICYPKLQEINESLKKELSKDQL